MPRSTHHARRRRDRRRSTPLYEALCLECSYYLLSVEPQPSACPNCGTEQLDEGQAVPIDFGPWSLAPPRDLHRPTLTQRF